MSYFKRSFLTIVAILIWSFSKGWMGIFLLCFGIPFLVIVFSVLHRLGAKDPVTLKRHQLVIIALSLLTTWVMPSVTDVPDSNAFTFISTQESSAVYAVAMISAGVGALATLLYALIVIVILARRKSAR